MDLLTSIGFFLGAAAFIARMEAGGRRVDQLEAAVIAECARLGLDYPPVPTKIEVAPLPVARIYKR